jgi:Arc/MetJ-type ribon-helix-helix transcriptional regulator
MRISKVLSVSLPPEMHSWAEEIARAENRTMSELVPEALRAYKAPRSEKHTGLQRQTGISQREEQ